MNENIKQIIVKHGVAEAAKLLHQRYSTVRALAIEVGIKIVRGRRVNPEICVRNGDIRRLREGIMTLHKIGKMHGIGQERVRQILLVFCLS